MWKIEYSREVRNYIYDSYPYTAEIWQLLKTLRTTANGLPLEGYTEISPNIFHWTALEHVVIYERYPERNLLYFFVLKPVNGG